MKYILVLAFAALFLQSAYAQDVLITKINESQYGAQNGPVLVKINS